MEQIITLGGILAVGFALLTFLAKQQFSDIKNGITQTRKEIQKSEEKTNERIDKLEEKTNEEIKTIKQDLNNIKGDFATTFVLREDFFRSMNGVEEKIRSIDSKMDKLLLIGVGKGEVKTVE